MKFLVCISPIGAVTFLSEAYGGRASDIQITKESGFISSRIHWTGDQIMADQGFTLTEEFAVACNATLHIPTFTKWKDQLEKQEVENTRKLAHVRIHVERVIGSVKERFRILRGPIPLHVLKSRTNEKKGEIPDVEKLVRVACALVNLSPGIVV